MGNTVNHFMVAFSAIIGLQMIVRNKIVSVVLSCLIGIASLLILGATISEFLKFANINSEAFILLFVGSLLAGITGSMAYFMSSKYFYK